MKALNSWALLLLLMITGCGGGDTLPLYPAENACDRPPDPHWQTLSPLAGQRIPLAGVWTEQDQVCVVGTEGLVLFKSGDEPFALERPATEANLSSVVTLSDGIILAAGSGGTITQREPGPNARWQNVPSPTTEDLNRMAVSGTQAWAVGQAGTVLQRLETGSWTSTDFPAAANLTGVAIKGDTLAVCGDQGQLWLRAGEQWLDRSDGPWLDADLHSVIWLEDGHLVVLGQEFYLQGEQGWQLAPFEPYSWMQARSPGTISP